MVFGGAHGCSVKWWEFHNEVNSSVLAWLNLEEMIGDLSWTMISYVCGWLRKSTELFSVAFGVEWRWMTEISLIVVQWEIVTISIERMDDWKNKPNSSHTEAVIWALHNAYYPFFFLITGLEQLYRQLNIQRVQMVLWHSQGPCWHALSHHPTASVWSTVQCSPIQHHYQGFFHLNQVEIDNRFSPSHWIRERHC